MSLTCPKCGGEMRSYERNSVTIDQCSECRGVFLDRGELERLIDAQAAYESQANVGGGADRYDDDDDPRYARRQQDPSGRRRRGGFLGDLFDLG